MSKKEIISAYVPRFVLIFCLIASIGVLVGSLSYISKKKPKNVPAKAELKVSTDKTLYIPGQEVKINLENDTDEEIFLTYPDIEIFELIENDAAGGQWKTIRTVWAGCGVIGGMPYLPLNAGGSYSYSWDQKEKWCIGENFIDMIMDSEEAKPGKYRVKTAIVERTKSAGEDPNNISGQPTNNFIYSNEFTIQEKQSEDVAVSTDKTEYEQGENIIATLNYRDKIYQWGGRAWSIQKMENGLWVDVQREGDLYFLCANVPECKNVNFEVVEECSLVMLCERESLYEVKDAPRLVWDQSYKIEEKAFSCNYIQRHPQTREITSSKIEEKSCAVFAKAQPGNYKIRFEYVADVNIEDLFDRKVDVKYAEKEFTIKEKTPLDSTDLYSCASDSDCVAVKADCCGCTAGGAATSINGKYQNEWIKKLNCAGIMCPKVISNDPSCFGAAKCVNDKCKLVNSGE